MENKTGQYLTRLSNPLGLTKIIHRQLSYLISLIDVVKLSPIVISFSNVRIILQLDYINIRVITKPNYINIWVRYDFHAKQIIEHGSWFLKHFYALWMVRIYFSLKAWFTIKLWISYFCQKYTMPFCFNHGITATKNIWG